MSQDFDEWWHNAYFRTDHPLYPVYKKLHKGGAALEYIDGLTRLLRVVDHDVKLVEQDLNANLPPRLRHIAHPSRITKTVREDILELAKKKKVRLVKREQRELERYVQVKVKGHMARHVKEEQEKHRRAVEKVFQTNPLGSILYDYGSPSLRYRTGRKSDEIGSFFLVAISEHLRERSGKPHFLLAANLLRAVRGQRGAWNRAARLQAMVRVAKFKKSGRNWKKDLRILQECYCSFRSGRPKPLFIASLVALEKLFSSQPGDLSFTYER